MNIGLLMFLIVLMVVVAALLPVILKQLAGGKVVPAGSLPYRKKDYLLTVAERSFFEVLQSVVGEQLHIFAKVRLADVVWIPKGTQNWQSHFNRVQSKQLDFILCDRQNVAPLLVIELDDSSHERADRMERDAFIDSALGAASLPILHVTAKRSYVPKELAALIEEKLR